MRARHIVSLTALVLAAQGCGGDRSDGPLYERTLLSAHKLAYSGDKLEAGRTELFVTNFLFEERKVSGTLGSFGNVTSWAWAPDNRHIAFVADQFADNIFELFIVDPNVGIPYKANPALQPGGNVVEFQWSPDGTKLAYRANIDSPFGLDLYVVNADGSGQRRLCPDLPPPQTVTHFLWSPDSSRIAYRADQDAADTFELYVAPANVSAPLAVKVSGLFAPGGNVLPSSLAFAWAGNGSRIAYLADQETVGMVELFSSTPTDALSNVKVSGTFASGSGQVGLFEWAPDSSRIAYLAGQETAGVPELFTSLPDGTQNVKVSRTLVPGGGVARFAFAPNSARIAYVADANQVGFAELFTVTPAGTGDVQVDPMVMFPGVTDFAWSPGGSRIAYSGFQDTFLVRELYTSSAAGTGNVKVSGTFSFIGSVEEFRWSPSGAHLAYRANGDSTSFEDLYVTNADSNAAGRVSGPNVSGGNVVSFRWDPDDVHLLYLADQSVLGQFELSLTSIFGGPQICSGVIVAGGQITDYAPIQ